MAFLKCRALAALTNKRRCATEGQGQGLPSSLCHLSRYATPPSPLGRGLWGLPLCGLPAPPRAASLVTAGFPGVGELPSPRQCLLPASMA